MSIVGRSYSYDKFDGRQYKWISIGIEDNGEICDVRLERYLNNLFRKKMLCMRENISHLKVSKLSLKWMLSI